MTKKNIISKVAPALFTALTLTSLAASMNPSLTTDLSTGISNSFKKGGYIEVGASGGAPAPTNIVNNAAVASPTLDNTLSNNSVSVTDQLCYRSDLGIVYTASAIVGNGPSVSAVNAQAGGTIDYTAVVTNNGPSTVTTASFELVYDDSLMNDPTGYATTTGTLSSVTYTGTGASRKATITVTGLTLAPTQTATLTYSAVVLGTATGTIPTSLTIKPTGPETSVPVCSMQDPIPANNENIPRNMNTTPVADLAINKSSNDPSTNGFGFGPGSNNGYTTTSSGASSETIGKVRSGANVTYTISVINNGPSTAAANITVTDTYNSAQLQFVSAGSGNANWTCTSPSAGTVTCVRTTNMINAEADTMPIIFKVIAQ
jgi:uncharacterized repeat protein (TIGR01451 family)